MIYDREESRRFHREMARRMAEPEDLRELRQQAERIEHEKRQAVQGYLHGLEKNRLRQQIRKAGERPCR